MNNLTTMNFIHFADNIRTDIVIEFSNYQHYILISIIYKLCCAFKHTIHKILPQTLHSIFLHLSAYELLKYTFSDIDANILPFCHPSLYWMLETKFQEFNFHKTSLYVYKVYGTCESLIEFHRHFPEKYYSYISKHFHYLNSYKF